MSAIDWWLLALYLLIEWDIHIGPLNGDLGNDAAPIVYDLITIEMRLL